MRTGEKILTLRESIMGDDVFVTAREKDRLIDYYRFSNQSYSRKTALSTLKERFRASQLVWANEYDEEFLKRVHSLRSRRSSAENFDI